MNNINRIRIAILGIIFCWSINHTIMHKRPPNLQHVKRKMAYYPKDSIEKKNYIVTHVTVSCFQPVKSQCDDDPLTTSDGSKINLEKLKKGKVKWCAISRDLLYLLPKDKPNYIWVDGYGLYEVKDVMNKRFKHSVDLLQHPTNKKMILRKNIEVKILL